MQEEWFNATNSIKFPRRKKHGNRAPIPGVLRKAGLPPQGLEGRPCLHGAPGRASQRGPAGGLAQRARQGLRVGAPRQPAQRALAVDLAARLGAR